MSDNIKLAKERMIAQGFQPLENAANMTAEARSARALEYIALYMERIDQKLELLVGDPDKPESGRGAKRPAMDHIVTALTSLANKLAGPGAGKNPYR